MSEVITLKVEGEIAYVALNRPEKRNAVNTDMLKALPEVIAKADQPAVRSIILYGEGAVFSAGIDFSSLASSDTGSSSSSGGRIDMSRFRRFVAESQASLNSLENIEKPVIGALHGYVGGLGLEIALACDARICASGT